MFTLQGQDLGVPWLFLPLPITHHMTSGNFPLFTQVLSLESYFNSHHPPQAHILGMLWMLIKLQSPVPESLRTRGPIKESNAVSWLTKNNC